MIERTEVAIEEQNPTRWQKLLAWLNRIDEAVNYDPVFRSDAMVRELGVQVSRLESRVIELEQRTEHTT